MRLNLYSNLRQVRLDFKHVWKQNLTLRTSGYKGGEFFLARSNTAESGKTVASCTSERPDLTHKDTISIVVAQCANEPRGIGEFVLCR